MSGVNDAIPLGLSGRFSALSPFKPTEKLVALGHRPAAASATHRAVKRIVRLNFVRCCGSQTRAPRLTKGVTFSRSLRVLKDVGFKLSNAGAYPGTGLL